MSERFIKLNRSDRLFWLLEAHPNAFLLLSLIALRARRISGHPDGLEIGEAYIGDWKKAGLTQKEYRNAKQKLLDLNLVKISSSNRTCQNRATSRATSGTIVKLLDSDIYDINPDIKGDLKGDRGATSGRPRGDKEEGIRKNKKEEEFKEKIKKEKIREWVELTIEEFEKLKNLHPESLLNEMLDILDAFNTTNQKHYPSDYGALKRNSWVHKKALENTSKPLINGNDEREWEKTNRDKFFLWKNTSKEALKHMEYRNGFIFNIKNGKDLSMKMNPDVFENLFTQIAGVKRNG